MQVGDHAILRRGLRWRGGGAGAAAPETCEESARPRHRRCNSGSGGGKKKRELGFDGVRELPPERIVRRHDRLHPRLDVPGQEHPDDSPEIDAEVLDSRSVGNGEIGGDANQQLVQRQALGPERDDLGELEPGEIVQLLGPAEVGACVLGPKDRRERQQVARNARLDSRIPGAVLGLG